ncbi:unnamed protein product [Clavelina lepadiformis]|uniref:Uncharacterized protein n=1 Tax=Clavelina lepadiformis TaxID=159417 RepID=A0ABP0FMZ5_CLALP
MPSSEIYICDDYDSSFVEIPQIIQTARVLCIISIVSAGASVVLIIAGLIFAILSLIYEKHLLKILTVIPPVVSFVLAFLSGVCVLHAVTQFDIESREENPYYVSTDVSTFLRGQCLYFGWIGGGLLIGGAIVSLHPAIVGIIDLKQDRRAN